MCVCVGCIRRCGGSLYVGVRMRVCVCIFLLPLKPDVIAEYNQHVMTSVTVDAGGCHDVSNCRRGRMS